MVEDRVVQVGRVEAHAVIQPLLAEDDRERVRLLARRAARIPYAHERIGVQERHDTLAEREEERRVAKHRRHGDRQIRQQSLHGRRVVENAILEGREAVHPLRVGAPP